MAIFGIFPTCFAIWLGSSGMWVGWNSGCGLDYRMLVWFLVVFILPEAGWLVWRIPDNMGGDAGMQVALYIMYR